jgi:2',3'-cyclic-nucleotide 2'-phosphodiesterase (5'-nucleotidase family)
MAGMMQYGLTQGNDALKQMRYYTTQYERAKAESEAMNKAEAAQRKAMNMQYGGMAGMAAGAGGGIAAGVGSGMTIGAAAGSVFPVVGTIIGGLAGTIAGSFF